MSRLVISPTTYQALAVGMPVTAVVLALFVVYPTWGRYNRGKAEVEQLRTKLKSLESAPLPPKDPVLTAAEATEAEPQDFLQQFTAIVQESGCEITSLQTDRATGSEGSTVRPVRSRVAITGHYPRIRALLWRLYRASRLFAVTDVSLTGAAQQPGDLGSARVTANFVLERYVTDPTAASR